MRIPLVLVLLLIGLPACGDGGEDSAADGADTDAQSADTSLLDTSDAEELEPAETGPNACDENPVGRVSLPADEAFHGEPVEWWYWTGHLQTEEGRWFGFEHVFFAVEYGAQNGQMAHHGITDIADGTFHYEQLYQFGEPAAVLDGFDLRLGPHTAVGGDGRDELHGEVDDYVLDLVLNDVKSPVLQHGDGYQDYDFGGYTYYYSRPRMAAEGTLRIGDETLPVTGSAWFDHQWGDLQNIIQTGWDWFALQLEDQREIMLFVVRLEDEPVLIGGSSTDADCVTTEIHAGDFNVEVLDWWSSPSTGCTWPMGWRIGVGEDEYTVTPIVPAQELESPLMTYWEGPAIVTGTVGGRAYVELVGYCD